jgi:hypothetical protein
MKIAIPSVNGIGNYSVAINSSSVKSNETVSEMKCNENNSKSNISYDISPRMVFVSCRISMFSENISTVVRSWSYGYGTMMMRSRSTMLACLSSIG